MKTIYKIVFLGVLGLGACTTTQTARRESVDDDVYYSRTNRPDRSAQNGGNDNTGRNERSYTQNSDQNTQNTDQYIQNPSADSTSYTGDNQVEGQLNVQNNQGYANSYDDYDYASRINRFSYPSYGFGYYDPFYNPYWYSPGLNFSMGFGFGMGYPYYGYGGFGGYGWGGGFGWGGLGYGGFYGAGYGYGGYYGGGYYGGGYYGGGYYGSVYNGSNPGTSSAPRRFRDGYGASKVGYSASGSGSYLAPGSAVSGGRRSDMNQIQPLTPGTGSSTGSVSRSSYIPPVSGNTTSGSSAGAGLNARQGSGYTPPSSTNGMINSAPQNSGGRTNVFRSRNQGNVTSSYNGYSPAQQVRPSNGYNQQRSDSYGVSRPNGGFNAPRFNPAPRSYSAPARSYSAPSRSFSAPSRSYSAPSGGGFNGGGGGGGGGHRGR